MTELATSTKAARMSDNIRCVQPGERGLFRLERAFGRWRRAWLRVFRAGYVERMRASRRGECLDCPHDIIDARDLKLYRNVCGFTFPASADAFGWRTHLPFARQGLVEVLVGGVGGLIAACVLAVFAPLLSVLPFLIGVFYLWFFRDPPRTFPTDSKVAVAPCDGVLDDLCEVPHCEALGGPALRLGISLSLFDVHLNRAPIAGYIDTLCYRPGRFVNAMRRGDHQDNEQFWTVFATPDPTPTRLAVRQIAGPMARTIVNEVSIDQVVSRSQVFGMIKFGSRTELYVPLGGEFEVLAQPGQRMVGGVTPVLRRLA